MTEINLRHPLIAERTTIDFAETREVSPATKRLYDGAVMVPYDEELFRSHDVKRGLRNADGSGVVAGLTRISDVHGYRRENGTLVPDEGKLTICGYNIEELVAHAQQEQRFGYEELVFLLLTGELPRQDELDATCARIASQRLLPMDYINEFPITTKSKSIMNVLARAVLMLYAFDETPDDISAPHEIDVALSLLARLPRIAAIAHSVRNAEFEGRRAHIPRPNPSYSMAETILQVLREGDNFTHDEAMLLDVMLMLHAEHGGGNNSSFTTHVLSSADTDPYSTYAAAFGSLKGHRHGGANHQVRAMQAEIKENVKNWEDDDEVAAYLAKIVNKQAYDGTGLVYGMGHAVYTLSDPRAVIGKRFAEQLAAGTEYEAELNLLKSIERLTPEVFAREKGSTKELCANVDMYSGFIYSMMGIPEDLFTPLFACARMAGWAAHRFEEIAAGKRIIRPAYKNTIRGTKPYVPIERR